jgi:hypothetical protein
VPFLISVAAMVYARDTETDEKAVLKDTFKPELKPWKRLLPELSVPYSEFGNPVSKARRQEQYVHFPG